MFDDSLKCTSDLSKEDLLRLLACLQSELEARDVVISALKSERNALINLKAKYGIINLDKNSPSVVDPFQALHRDSLVDSCRTPVDGADLRESYDFQLMQLENLITSQRSAQEKMREQLNFMESNYMKVRGELEEERRKHEHDTAQGDDVLVMLEKERERLKSEVDYEKTQNKKLEKDIKRLILSWKEQSILLARQKEVAVALLKERHLYMAQPSDRKLIIDHGVMQIESPQIPPYTESCVQTEVTGSQNLANNEVDKIDGHLRSCCEALRENLEMEVTLKHDTELRFKRLQEDYAKLQEELNSIRNTKLNPPSCDSHSPSGCNSNSSACVATSASTADADTSSAAVTPLRTKPHPPTRRSSEVTNPNNTPVPSVIAIPVVNGVSCDENASTVGEVALKKVGSPSMTTTRDDDSSAGLSSRSSTPSPPPPPPPPVQLHYPYPGMQSHLQTRVSATNSSNNSVPFFIRPTGSHVSTSSGVTGRPRAPLQTPSLPTNSCGLVHRLNSTSSSVRPSASRTSTSANFYQPPQVTAQSSPFSVAGSATTTTGAAFPIKTPPATTGAALPFAQRRASPSPAAQQPGYPAAQQHHFPVYQNRYQHQHRHAHQFTAHNGTGVAALPTTAPPGPAPNAVRAVRSTRPSSPPEHICTGGK